MKITHVNLSVYIIMLAFVMKKIWANSAFTSEPEELLVELYCNGFNTSNIINILKSDKNKIWVSENTLKMCHAPTPYNIKENYNGQVYYLLTNLKNTLYLYDSNELTLNILVPSLTQPSQTINLNPINTKKIRPIYPGSYINYDISLQREQVTGTNSFASMTDFVFFNKIGVGDTNYLIKKNDESLSIVRLNTTWTLDKPESMTTWRFGDTVNGTTIWSGLVQFGGIQYATNFATQPRFIPFPLPAFKGQAIIPSTINFYLDNQLRTSQQLMPGAFEIEGLPTITGAGDLAVQTKDLLGRETITNVPYYVSTQLLQEDLISFSYETGLIRNNFGINSNDYSNILFSGTFQKGITNNWTSGWHGELLLDQQTFGVNNSFLLNNWMQLDFSMAGSLNHYSPGGLILMGLQRNARVYNIGCQLITTTKEFRQLGLQADALSPSVIIQSIANYNSRLGTTGISYTSRISRSEPNIYLFTINYNKTIFNRIFMVTNFIHQGGQFNQNTYFMGFIYSPNCNYTTSLNYVSDPQNKGVNFNFSKNLPTDTGYGYRLTGSTGANGIFETDFALQSDYGLLQMMYSQISGTQNMELDASGSIVYYVGKKFFARTIQDSFIVVDLDEIPDVPIYKSNQQISSTNRHGVTLLPQALSYQENMISIDPRELPLNVTIDKSKIAVYPYYRSGSYVTFPITKMHNINLQLLTENNVPPPAGAALILDQGGEYMVGYEGKVLISSEKALTNISGTIYWHDQKCRFSSPSLDFNDSIIEPVAITCHSLAN